MSQIVLLGANGQVGWELRRALAPLGSLVAADRRQCDLTNRNELINFVARHAPTVIVNAAAYTAVDKAESDSDRAFAINADAVATLAEHTSRTGALLVHYSTDYVFNGETTSAYVETDSTAPLNVYGHSKLAGERAIVDSGCAHLIFRTSWVFARQGHNFIKTILRLAQTRDELTIVADQYGAPTSAELIADITAHALRRMQNQPTSDALCGLYHLTACGRTNWYDYARYLIDRADEMGAKLCVRSENVWPIASSDYPQPAQRPAYSLLNTEKLQAAFDLTLPDWTVHADRTLFELVAQT